MLRPIGSTISPSVITVPAPPIAYFARCWKCQSVAKPSGADLYICIGAITIRFGKVTSRSRKELNSRDSIMQHSLLSLDLPSMHSGYPPALLGRHRGAHVLVRLDRAAGPRSERDRLVGAVDIGGTTIRVARSGP